MKPVLLSIMRTVRLQGTGRKAKPVTDTTYELYQDESNTRTIDIVTIFEYGKKKDFHFDRRKMDVETGKYLSEFGNRYEVDKRTATTRIAEWLALPVRESYKNHLGLTQGETRFLK